MSRNSARNPNQSSWRLLKGRIKDQWLRLTDEDIEELVRRQKQLEGKLQERYGWDREEARKQVEEFYRRQRRLH